MGSPSSSEDRAPARAQPASVISGLITVEVLDQHHTDGDPELLNFRCSAGARTDEQRLVVWEVQTGLNEVYEGTLAKPKSSR